MNWKTVVNAQRLGAFLISLVFLYIGDAAAGFPLDWWVPLWALSSLDALAIVAGFAWSLGASRSSYVAAEEYGEYAGKKEGK